MRTSSPVANLYNLTAVRLARTTEPATAVGPTIFNAIAVPRHHRPSPACNFFANLREAKRRPSKGETPVVAFGRRGRYVSVEAAYGLTADLRGYPCTASLEQRAVCATRNYNDLRDAVAFEVHQKALAEASATNPAPSVRTAAAEEGFRPAVAALTEDTAPGVDIVATTRDF